MSKIKNYFFVLKVQYHIVQCWTLESFLTGISRNLQLHCTCFPWVIWHAGHAVLSEPTEKAVHPVLLPPLLHPELVLVQGDCVPTVATEMAIGHHLHILALLFPVVHLLLLLLLLIAGLLPQIHLSTTYAFA